MRLRKYQTPHEVKDDFSTVDFLKASKAVSNIGGNKYRLVVTLRYDLQKVFIRHVLTRREYDRKTADDSL